MLESLDKITELETNSSSWQPDDIYWNTLLPRIHLKIEEKRALILPSWLYRSIAPAAAVLLIIILSMNIFKTDDHHQDTIPFSIGGIEIANYISEEDVINPYLNKLNVSDDTLGIEDVTVIRDILKNENNVASYYEDRAGSIFETVNKMEAEKLYALLSEYVNDK
jgi:hypothetical protein